MNVVFIVLDTFRKDRLSVYNDEIDFTENLENFCEDAMVFEDAVSQAPWTLPSHASMFTGEYPWEHGATQKNLYLETDTELLVEKFHDRGYATACYTSNTWISPYTGMAEGFDEIDNFFGILPSDFLPSVSERIWHFLNNGRGEWLMKKLMHFGEKVHMATEGGPSKTPRTVEKAKQFIEREEGDFFLFLNFMDCHLPYYPPEEYIEKHDAPDPSTVCQKAHEHNAGIQKADFDKVSRLYDAEVDYLDDNLGELFQFFEDKDIVEDTVFVIVSDHGENLGETGMMGHQFSVSEPLVSVPLIVKAPGFRGEVDEQFELRELYSLVPALAFDAGYDVEGTDYALGGYEYPNLDISLVPDHEEELGHRLRFVRGEGKRLVRKGEEEPEDSMETLDGEATDIDQEFVKRMDSTGEAESGSQDIDEEHVKQRLEDLGYM